MGNSHGFSSETAIKVAKTIEDVSGFSGTTGKASASLKRTFPGSLKKAIYQIQNRLNPSCKYCCDEHGNLLAIQRLDGSSGVVSSQEKFRKDGSRYVQEIGKTKKIFYDASGEVVTGVFNYTPEGRFVDYVNYNQDKSVKNVVKAFS